MSDWDISQERAFIENLLCQRFNFFLIFFSIVVAGAIAVAPFNMPTSCVILAIGNVICWLLRSALNRSQEKLDIILDQILPEAHPDHPAIKVDKRSRKGGTRRRLIGETIPLICCWFLTLSLLFIIAQTSCWKLP